MTAPDPQNTSERRTAQLAARLLQDAWTEAWAATWLRRAALFEWAAPREGDYIGRATEEDLDAQAARTINAAIACRNRASGADGAATWHLAGVARDLTTTDDQARLDAAHDAWLGQANGGSAA